MGFQNPLCMITFRKDCFHSLTMAWNPGKFSKKMRKTVFILSGNSIIQSDTGEILLSEPEKPTYRHKEFRRRTYPPSSEQRTFSSRLTSVRPHDTRTKPGRYKIILLNHCDDIKISPVFGSFICIKARCRDINRHVFVTVIEGSRS